MLTAEKYRPDKGIINGSSICSTRRIEPDEEPDEGRMIKRRWQNRKHERAQQRRIQSKQNGHENPILVPDAKLVIANGARRVEKAANSRSGARTGVGGRLVGRAVLLDGVVVNFDKLDRIVERSVGTLESLEGTPGGDDYAGENDGDV